MPTPIWDQLFKPLVAGQRWIAAGLFEPAVREKAGMRWTPGDEVLLRLFGKLVELAFLAVPDEIRLHPRALAAYRRGRGRLPATRRWSRRRRSWHRRVTDAGCRCTTSPAAPRNPPVSMERAGSLWCTPRSRLPGCARPVAAWPAPLNARRSARALWYRQIAAAAATLRLSAPPGHRDAHPVVRQRRRSRPASRAIGPEQPRRRRRQQRLGLVKACLAVHRGGQHLQPGRAQRGRRRRRRRAATTTGIEKMLPADARRHLPLYGSTLCPARTTAAGAHRVGDADQRAGIARARRSRRRPATSAGQPASTSVES